MHGALINIALDGTHRVQQCLAYSVGVVNCFQEMMKTDIVSILVGYLAKENSSHRVYWHQDVAILRNIASYGTSSP